MDFAAVTAGPLSAKLADHKRRLIVEDAGGATVAVLDRLDMQGTSTVEATGGRWTVRKAEDVGGGKFRWEVVDGDGKRAAELIPEQRVHRYAITLGEGDPLTWEFHGIRAPHYRVEGLFSANRKLMNRFVAGISKRPFDAEVTAALAARPDASLVLLLATWCTRHHIAIEIATSASSSGYDLP